MREIKFRAWDNLRKKMLCKGVKFMIYEDGSWSGVDAISGGVLVEEDDILMQYTGLKDKNGKEIYEGDIVKFSGRGKWIVEWESGENDGYSWEGYSTPIKSDYKTFEIIGNIYENPELIKEDA